MGRIDKKEIRIFGVLHASKRDDNGVAAIEIKTEEEDYEVEPSGKGRELLHYIGEDVKVVGKVSLIKGKNRIKVIKFEVVDSFEDDDYDAIDYYEDYEM